ncbi:phage tail tip lysozyme [Paraburkholderia sp. BCC1876]|uniref:phage tail tip lysozyme n=1 Tax=Paraburkholderia sp. BCC1876 TaxID=2676303 RepID=UPI001591ADD6|nr:phage tail tip lysozyme [Paraburkholderia sp. BCC1876]
MADVKIGINGGGGSPGQSGVDAEAKKIEKLAKALSQVGAEVAKLSKLNFEPPSIKDFSRSMAQLEAQWKQAIQAMPQLRRAMSQSGQAGVGLANLDFAKMTPNPATAARWKREAYARTVAGTAYDLSLYNAVNSTGHAIPSKGADFGPTNAQAANLRAKADAANAKAAEKAAAKVAKDSDTARLREDRANERAKMREVTAATKRAAKEDSASSVRRTRAWRGAAGSIGTAVGTAAGAAGGGIGQIIGGGISGAAGAFGGGGGIGSMLGGGVVGMITGGLAMAGQFISHGVELAGNRAGDADTLKRQMGDLGVSFSDLIAGTEKFNQGLGVSSAEFAKLELSAEAASGGLYRTADEVGRATAGGVGFARAFGMDPSQGINTLSGSQRMDSHASLNELAVKFANAIQGAQGKALPGEVAAIIQGIGSQQNRLTADAPNLDRIGNMFNSVLKSMPGMTASHAAGILGQANSATQGMMGREATANLAMRAFGGLDPIQADWLLEGGLGATVSSRLGKGSNYAGFTGGGMSGNTTVASMLMRQMRADLGIKGVTGTEQQQELLANGIKNAFGLSSMDDAVALSKMSSSDTDSLMGYVKKNHIDLNSMNPESLARLTGLSKTDSFAGVDAVYQDMRGGLTDDERDVLDKKEKAAQSGNPQDVASFKAEIGRVASGMGQSDDLGTNMRQAAKDLDDIATNIGQRIAPGITSMESWLEALAKKMLGIGGEMGPPRPDTSIPDPSTTAGMGAASHPQGAGSGGLGGDMTSRAAALKSYLLSQGVPEAQTDGILGNAARESSVTANAWNPDHTMYGLYQFNGANRKAYDVWAKANKRPGMFDSSAIDQTDFMLSQIRKGGSEYGRMGAFWSATSPGVAGTAFDSGYERPASVAQENPIRFDLANRMAQIPAADQAKQAEAVAKANADAARYSASYGGNMGGLSGAGANISVVLEHTNNNIADGRIKSQKVTKTFHAPLAQGSTPRFRFSTDTAS